LAANAPSSLYDGVLEAIRRLSANPMAMERRCVLVAANGSETKESRHPVVTCISAADTVRVAVHALILAARPGDTAGEARLRELASKTGGAARLASGASALPAALARLREVEAIRIAPLESGGGKRAVRIVVPDAAPAAGTLAPRASLEMDDARRFPWAMLALGGGLTVGAAGIALVRGRSYGALRVVGGGRLQAVPITRGGVTIGSAPGNRLVLDDEGISRHHAVVQMRRGRVTFVDLKSTNGTRVNGARITAQPLSDGDRILLAEAVELVYQRRSRGTGVKSIPKGSEKTRGTPSPRSQRDDDDDADK
jgi:hypothetical protein